MRLEIRILWFTARNVARFLYFSRSLVSHRVHRIERCTIVEDRTIIRRIYYDTNEICKVHDNDDGVDRVGS